MKYVIKSTSRNAFLTQGVDYSYMGMDIDHVDTNVITPMIKSYSPLLAWLLNRYKYNLRNVDTFMQLVPIRFNEATIPKEHEYKLFMFKDREYGSAIYKVFSGDSGKPNRVFSNSIVSIGIKSTHNYYIDEFVEVVVG